MLLGVGVLVELLTELFGVLLGWAASETSAAAVVVVGVTVADTASLVLSRRTGEARVTVATDRRRSNLWTILTMIDCER